MTLPYRSRLFAARWTQDGGIGVVERTEPSVSPGSVRAHYYDGELMLVVAFHKTADSAEQLVMEHVRDLLTGPVNDESAPALPL